MPTCPICKEEHNNQKFCSRECTRKGNSGAEGGKSHPLYGVRGEENPNFGRSQSDETKRKISQSLVGHDVSDETREKISESQLQLWENLPNDPEAERPLSGKEKELIRDLFDHECQMDVEEHGRSGEAIDVPHLDQNPENNSADNLTVMCRKCHRNYDLGNYSRSQIKNTLADI